MIQKYIDKFQKNKDKLSAYLMATPQGEYDSYKKLLIKTIELCLNDSELYYNNFDIDKITVIDDGDYQGSLLFLIPLDTYQPAEYDYITTYVGYGSCSGCDTLLSISGYDTDYPSNEQLKAYLLLCLHMIEHMEWFREAEWRK